MKAIAAYMANRTGNREHEDNPRSEHSPYRREYENRNEYEGGEARVYDRHPNQYTTRSGMDVDQPQDNEMRRRRDSGGRYMTYDDGAEARYRGKDGQWKAGRRRGEYDGGVYNTDPMGTRMGDDDDDDEEDEGKEYGVRVIPKNVIEWPYGPHIQPENRMIGFGANPREYETRNHYGEESHMNGMKAGEHTWESNGRVMPMNRETAERWVRNMKGEDSARPTGGRWTMEELKPMAQKFGIRPDSEEFIEFYAMTNAMYSDYCAVAKKFNITSPEYYGMMALAWMRDKDAMPNKTAMYYECCVMK